MAIPASLFFGALFCLLVRKLISGSKIIWHEKVWESFHVQFEVWGHYLIWRNKKHPEVFLELAHYLFSGAQRGVRGPIGVLRDRAIFFENNIFKIGKFAKNEPKIMFFWIYWEI